MAANYCWVLADGSMESGRLPELLRDARLGRLPHSHPVWCEGWSEWLPLAEVRARLEREAQQTGESLSVSAPELELDADATMEDLTLPRPRLPSTGSVAPPGVSHTLRPPTPSTATAALWPVITGCALAVTGALIALGVVASSWSPPVSSRLSRAAFAARARIESSTSSVRSAELPRCRPLGSAQLLATRMELGSAIHVSPTRDGVAVGIRTTARSGLGLWVSESPVRVTRELPFFDPVHIAGVVPTEGGSSFVVDRWARTLPSKVHLQVGMTPNGFSTISHDGRQRTLWAGQASQVISRPSVAHVSGRGFALAFRRGDAPASIRFGWLGEDGSSASDLSVLSVASGLVDPPSLAAYGERVAIAYATRQPADAPWTIELGQARFGQAFASTTTLRLAGAVRDRRAPSIAPLADGGWLITWVEGNRDTGRSVRAQRLSAALRPSGEPLVLHTPEQAVGTTALAVSGSTGVILFGERTNRALERLWGAAVECR